MGHSHQTSLPDPDVISSGFKFSFFVGCLAKLSHSLASNNNVGSATNHVSFLIFFERGYAVAVPLYKKVSHGVSWERKRDIAKSRGHVIEASLTGKHPTGEVSRYNWRAVYRYTVADEERQYVAHFKHPATPPLYLYLYYVDDPDKLFSCEEYHYENHKGLLLFPIIFLPWILAVLALVLLGVDLSGF